MFARKRNITRWIRILFMKWLCTSENAEKKSGTSRLEADLGI